MKTLKGNVVSDKMTKTATVLVTTLYRHPMYGKRIKKSRRFAAHNEIGAKTGDNVIIGETRPMSATKRWIIKEIVKK